MFGVNVRFREIVAIHNELSSSLADWLVRCGKLNCVVAERIHTKRHGGSFWRWVGGTPYFELDVTGVRTDERQVSESDRWVADVELSEIDFSLYFSSKRENFNIAGG
ncbi:hypothetical protein C464_17497 [Halorubrum coriense DSM 10284]|uniref:Uncharacterized protein n=1 Tax=Halorubrum coriense DSM 10284 TaxID=1227466 RepID=M0E4G5_9EURY|nr:hypothetical protein C464_17497 [Halorubrum coriense DSM 10284]